MYVQVDLSTIPPTVAVEEADDLTSLKVVCPRPEHSFVDPEELRRLAGRADDTAWNEGFGAMVEYARGKGWVDADGALQAHLEFG